MPDFSSLYTSNAGPHAATVQVALTEEHRDRQLRIHGAHAPGDARELPHLSAYFQSGGIVDAVLNQGLPAPIDVQLSGSNIDARLRAASGDLAADDPQAARRQRRLHSAGRRLPVAAARHRSRARGAISASTSARS